MRVPPPPLRIPPTPPVPTAQAPLDGVEARTKTGELISPEIVRRLHASKLDFKVINRRSGGSPSLQVVYVQSPDGKMCMPVYNNPGTPGMQPILQQMPINLYPCMRLQKKTPPRFEGGASEWAEWVPKFEDYLEVCEDCRGGGMTDHERLDELAQCLDAGLQALIRQSKRRGDSYQKVWAQLCNHFGYDQPAHRRMKWEALRLEKNPSVTEFLGFQARFMEARDLVTDRGPGEDARVFRKSLHNYWLSQLQREQDRRSAREFWARVTCKGIATQDLLDAVIVVLGRAPDRVEHLADGILVACGSSQSREILHTLTGFELYGKEIEVWPQDVKEMSCEEAMEFILKKLKSEERNRAEEESYSSPHRRSRERSPLVERRPWDTRLRAPDSRSIHEVAARDDSRDSGRGSSNGRGGRGETRPGVSGQKWHMQRKQQQQPQRKSPSPQISEERSVASPVTPRKKGDPWVKGHCAVCWALDVEGKINHGIYACPNKNNTEVCGFCARRGTPHWHSYWKCPVREPFEKARREGSAGEPKPGSA